MRFSLEKEVIMGIPFVWLQKKLLNSFWENWLNNQKYNFDHLSTYFSTILTNLERFNQNGAFTGEGGHDGHSIYAIRKKVTEQFLRKLHLSPQNGQFWPKNGHKSVKKAFIKNPKNMGRRIDSYYHVLKFEENSSSGCWVTSINGRTDRRTDIWTTT